MDAHNRIVAEVAKMVLGPLGFRRKGRSRTWLWDHGWWVTVVEFQPSAWARGSGVNTSAHWLWIDQPHMSFDYLQHSETFVQYASDAQFAGEVTAIAHSAAQEATRLQGLFPTVGAAAEVLAKDERELPRAAQGGWGAYNAGMAMALAGRIDEATALFESVLDERVQASVAPVRVALDDPTKFQQVAQNLISEHRRALRLPPGGQ